MVLPNNDKGEKIETNWQKQVPATPTLQVNYLLHQTTDHPRNKQKAWLDNKTLTRPYARQPLASYDQCAIDESSKSKPK